MSKGQRSKNKPTLVSTGNANKKESGGALKKVLIAAAVIVVLLLLIGLTVYNMSQDQGWFEGNDVVMKTENFSVNGGMFSYFFRESYMSTYNLYYSVFGENVSSYIDTTKSLKEQSFGSDGQTWYDYILESAKTSVTEYLSLCEKARAEGVALEKEDRDTINSAIADIKNASKTSGLSANDYIRYIFGKGVNESKIRRALEIEQLATKYAKQVTDAVDVSDEALEAAYAADPDSYDKVSYLTYAFKASDLITEEPTDSADEAAEPADSEEATEPVGSEEETEPAESEEETEPVETEEATEPAESESETEPADSEKETETEPSEEEQVAMADIKHYAEELAEIDSEDDFKAYVKNYALNVLGKSEEDAQKAADGVLSVDVSYSESSDAIKWAFGAKKGESTVIASSDGKTQTVYVLVSERARIENDGHRTARHVLFGKDEYPDEGAKAKEVYDQWVADGATEDGLAALAAEYSTDAGSKDKGGLYEDIHKGQFVEPFNTWLFEDRKEGDHDLLETEYGWHIVYFIGAEEPTWKSTITSNLQNDAYQAVRDSAEEEYPVTTFDDLIKIDA